VKKAKGTQTRAPGQQAQSKGGASADLTEAKGLLLLLLLLFIAMGKLGSPAPVLALPRDPPGATFGFETER
jgi:hypothetical protein